MAAGQAAVAGLGSGHLENHGGGEEGAGQLEEEEEEVVGGGGGSQAESGPVFPFYNFYYHQQHAHAHQY